MFALQSIPPDTLAEFLAWLTGAGAGILWLMILSACLEAFPRFAGWYDPLSPKAKQLMTIVGSIVISLIAFFLQVAFGLAELPQGALAWGEFVFIYIVIPLLGGIAVRTIAVLTPRDQAIWLKERQ